MNLLRPALVSIGFLTRLPVPTGEVNDKELGAAVGWFPLAGLIVGIFCASADYLTRWALAATPLGLPARGLSTEPVMLLGSLSALVANVLVTGGLHLDGLADTADGLAVRADRKRSLEIMKDSRIGAFGAIWLTLDILGRAILPLALPYHHVRSLVFLFAPVAGRLVQACGVTMFPYAREAGTGKPFNKHAGKPDLLRAMTIVILLTAAFSWYGGASRLGIVLLTSALVGVTAAKSWAKRLCGLTGDTYGALNEVVEITFMAIGALII